MFNFDWKGEEPMKWKYLGLIEYREAWRIQQELRYRRIAGKIDDTLLLLEHPPVVTLGKLRGEQSLLFTPELLERRGVQLVRSDRGGDATLHAPGQLVGYLIFDIRALKLTIPQFAEKLARGLSDYLWETYGIEGKYDPKYPGVWVGMNKIAAFGFNVYRGVTMHGFALNLTNDLDLFDLIIPCGLRERGVTSVEQELQRKGEGKKAEKPEIAAKKVGEKIKEVFFNGEW